MQTVLRNNLECVKELAKLEETNFNTKNNDAESLLYGVRCLQNGERKGKAKWKKMIKYLLERKKKETLAEITAYQVAVQLHTAEDAKKLDIPHSLHSLVIKFFDK